MSASYFILVDMVERLQNVSSMKDVRFRAFVSSDFTLTARTPMKFGNVQGVGYDKNTGIFTSPMAGVYHFHWSVLTKKGSQFALNFIQKSVGIRYRSWTDSEDPHTTLTGTVILSLNKGEQVYLQTYQPKGFIHGRYGFSVFSGELLRY